MVFNHPVLQYAAHVCLLLIVTAAPATTAERLRPDDPTEERPGNTCLPPALPGLNLVLDLGAEPLDSAALPNGEWWLQEGTKYRTLLLESRRLPLLEYGEDSVLGLIRFGWPEAREIAVEPYPELSAKTGHPALKAEFLTGENEDTWQFVAALVFTDEWNSWFVLSSQANEEFPFDEMEAPNAVPPGADLKQGMETLLLGIKAADPFDGGFLPGFGPIVHIAGDDSPLRISVMDALVKIKKVVGPEHSRWIPPLGTAYRYEGPGAVEGKPALIFSFGMDDPGKYTAARHFAVAEPGTVYEMDGETDGEYWEWDEKGVMWWGEYQRGDTVLRVQNYREGPADMYFVFSFVDGAETVLDGTAAVRGRTARDGGLVFTLTEGDMTVIVTTDPENDGVPKGKLSDLEGVYRVASSGDDENGS